MTAFEYLEKNREWLFSGVGVAVVGFALSYLWHRFFPKKSSKDGAVVIVQVTNSGAPSDAMLGRHHGDAPAQITKVASITLAEIVEALDKAPPLQKDDIAKHYSGLIVQWETKLYSAKKDDGDNVRLTLDFGSKNSHLVHCTVRLTDYRELGVLPKGAPITVMGRIKAVEYRSAMLEDVQLFLHSVIVGEST